MSDGTISMADMTESQWQILCGIDSLIHDAVAVCRQPVSIELGGAQMHELAPFVGFQSVVIFGLPVRWVEHPNYCRVVTRN